MILGQRIEKKNYTRTSKNGREHTYYRKATIVVLRCDNCGVDFERERRKIDPKRLTNNYFHVCSNCDAKRFAQKRGVEKKQVWNIRASSDIPISKL